MRNKLFQKLFGKKIQLTRLILASFGFIIGLSIVVITIDFYFKLNHIIDPNTSGQSYILVNKKVNLGNIFGGSGISESKIKKLKSHPAVDDVFPISSNNFKTWLELDTVGIRLVTDFFFESFPDEFIGDKPDNFKWKEGDKLIPIIVPKDFLNLYNFGYALSQGLPQVSSSIAKLVKGKLTLKGKNKREYYQVKIVAFSDNVPTVIVPQTFMQYGNKKFANKTEADIDKGRLAIKIRSKEITGLPELLDQIGLETKKEKFDKDQIKLILSIVAPILLAIGICFVLLSIIVMELNYALIFAESKEEMKILIQLGYTPQMIFSFIWRRFIKSLIIPVLISLLIYLAFAYKSQALMEMTGFETSLLNHTAIATGTILITSVVFLFKIELNKVLNKYSYES